MFATAISASGSASERRRAASCRRRRRSPRCSFRRLDRRLVDVDADDRLVAELARRDREHARAAADVEQARPLQRLDQLEAELRRRVRTGSEREPGVDHDRHETGRGPLPRRPDPERADLDRAVEAHPLALPAVGHGSTRMSPNLARSRSAPAPSVNATSSSPPRRRARQTLPETARASRASPPRRARRERRRSAQQAQRKALFSFSKKPSSGLYVSSSPSARTRRAAAAAPRSAAAGR